MGVSAWQVATDLAIPALAILVPTVIAILLARNERRQAATAREEERHLAARDREEARQLAAHDRENVRRDGLLEELIALYAFFVSANPNDESWSPYLRLLRARLIVLQTIPSAQALAHWLVSHQPRGMAAMERVVQSPARPVPWSSDFQADMMPMSEWADEMIQAIALWMRREFTDEMIEADLARRAPAQGRDGSGNTE